MFLEKKLFILHYKIGKPFEIKTLLKEKYIVVEVFFIFNKNDIHLTVFNLLNMLWMLNVITINDSN